MQIKDFFKKLQNLPENKKKIILWVFVGVIAVILLFIWVDVAAKRFALINKNFQKIQIPTVENNFK